MIKPILQKNDSRLRQKSLPVADINDQSLVSLKSDMLDTLHDQPVGVAISAVQMGSPLRLFLVETKPVPNRPDLKPVGPLFFFNPELTFTSEKHVDMSEACLSIDKAELYGIVSRPERIRIRFTSETGEVVEQKYSGFLARVIQHEIDHLNGILFTDIAYPESVMPAEEFRKKKRK